MGGLGGLGGVWGSIPADDQRLIIDLVFTVLLPFTISLAARLYRVWMSQMPAAQHDLASTLVGQVVAAVEQLYSNAPAGSGAAKKAEAERLAADLLAHFGISIDQTLLNVLIESAVAGLSAGQGAMAAPAPVPAPVRAPALTPMIGTAAVMHPAATN